MRKCLLLVLLWPATAAADPAYQARVYLAYTATPGGTMQRQGLEQSLSCLHPKFVWALAAAINLARDSGLPDAGIYSACRPPVLGVGGFRDKHKSLHAYGLAVDMAGIGRPGSDDARKWHDIATRHGLVNPYGWRHGSEWNHYQGTETRAVGNGHPMREQITPHGPRDLQDMWRMQAGGLLPPPLQVVVVPLVESLSSALGLASLVLTGAVAQYGVPQVEPRKVKSRKVKKSKKAKQHKVKQHKKKRCKSRKCKRKRR